MMRRAAGFTIVEMLVALALGLLVVGGVAAVLVSSSSIYRSSDGRAQIQESSRFALTMMQQDIRMAGYLGCFNPAVIKRAVTNLADNAAQFDGDYATGLGGYEAGPATWTPALDDAIGSLGAHAPVPGSDVLVVRAPIGQSLPLSAPMGAGADPIPLASTEGLVAGGLAVVADCNAANVIIVTAVPADMAILHEPSRNSAAALTRAFSSFQHASVTPVASMVYFIAPAASGVPGQRAMWRQLGREAAEEVADGVDSMQLEYGIDTDADMTPNMFVKADLIGARPVTAVKISLLLKSSDNKLLAKAATYTFEGRAPQTASDRRLYTPFTTTISLRNQVN
jgi:type IV pilus assembly protein PilW